MISTSSALSTNQAGTNAVFSAVNSGNNTATTKSDNEVTEDRFLKLLVAQMQNQDPLNPLDNAQVTSQMAQISTVNGIEKLNVSMSKFADSATQTRAINEVGMIGQDVLVSGSRLDWKAQEMAGIRMGVDLPADADSVKLEVLDQGGVAVNTINLGARQAGSHAVIWDGRNDMGTALPDGTYSLRVSANAGSQALAASALTAQRVMGVTEVRDAQGNPSTQIQTADGRARSSDSVRGIFRPL
jgi:flagellar basal-body rod modification protein FlgD